MSSPFRWLMGEKHVPKATILIVEDNAILAMDLQGMITRLGYTVAGPLASGEEAIAFLQGKKVDLVLMDIELAGAMNGIAAAETLHRTVDIPIVFLTGFSQDPLLEQAKIAAPYGYLIKPVPERELAATLEIALHRHSLDRELKESRIALQESETRHRRLFENMTQGVVYQTVNDEIISANPAAQRILGLTLDQLLGKTSLDPRWKAIREDGSDLPGEEHPSMIALGTGKPVERFIMGVIKPSENAYTWISVTAVPIFHSDERTPFQVYVTFDDITEQRQAEENYQKLFKEMLDGFALHEIILRL